MAGPIIHGVDDSESAKEAARIARASTRPRSSLLESISTDVSRRAPRAVVVVPAAEEGGTSGDRAIENANGGIVRFGLGSGGRSESAGGIVRFDFGFARR
jgi:hypothetical protein